MRFFRIAADDDLLRSPGAWLFLFVLIVYFCLELRVARAKPMWFDETCTMTTVTQPTWHKMFQAEPPDGNPPLMDVLTRPSTEIFGANQVALRLPELLALMGAMVAVYLFAGRRVGAAAGAAGAVLLATSPIGAYAVEGRPYGLLTGMLALMLVFWQRAAERRPRRGGALTGLAVSTFALILANPFGITYAALPLFAGEAVRFYRSRRFDRGVAIAILIGFSALLIALPMDAKIHHLMIAYAGPSYRAAVAVPTRMRLIGAVRSIVLGSNGIFVWPIAVLTLLFYGSSLQSKSASAEKTGKSAIPAHEWAALVVVCSLVVVLWLLAAASTHYFFERYTFPAAVGVVLLLVLLCGRLPGRQVVMLGLTVSFLWTLAHATHNVSHSEWDDPSEHTLIAQGNPDEPVVVANSLDFPVMWWYASPALRSRLHFMGDLKPAAATPDFAPALFLIAQNDRHLLPYKLDEISSFLAQHPSFLLVYKNNYPNSDEGVPHYLEENHYQVRELGSDNGLLLAQVTAPGANAPQP